MESVALPKKIDFKEGDSPSSGSVIIQPCFPGYGITLGNSIRRVLLSSLPGAAVVGVKIEGIDHEFMTLPHLKEDILEFILNLKQIRLKVFSEETIKLKLEVHGEKEIKASDIEKSSSVEIKNPDLVLGHITDMGGNLKAEIFVSQGMGYEMIENREGEAKEIGYIEMDSIFSPVVSAGVKVENVRVGKMTNWDKLIINIETDGTMTPEDSFKESVSILIKQYQALIGVSEKSSSLEVGDTKDNDNIVEVPEDKTGDDTASLKEEEVTEDEVEEKPKKKRGRPRKTE